MKKKLLSFIVIICTVICVSIMIFGDKIKIHEEYYKNKIEVLNIFKFGRIVATNDFKYNNEKKIPELNEEQNEINKKEKNSNNNVEKYKTTNPNDGDSDTTHQNIKTSSDYTEKEKDKENGGDDKKEDKKKRDYETGEEKYKSDYSKSSKDNLPVFKVSKAEIKDNLTLGDKKKLLSIASKLSAIDYEKINKYLETGSDDDVKNTISLLKNRLSDKDYEKVRTVAEKFINLDVVEQ